MDRRQWLALSGLVMLLPGVALALTAVPAGFADLGAGRSPAVCDGRIAYVVGQGADADIYFDNGLGSVRISSSVLEDRDPVVGDGWVAWLGWDGNDWEIFLWDGSAAQQITDNNTDDDGLVMAGHRLAWRGDSGGDTDIFVWEEGASQVVADDAGWDGPPKMDGTRIVWAGAGASDADIFLWQQGSVTVLPAPPGDDSDPVVLGNRVAWVHDDGADKEIWFWDGATPAALTDNGVDDLAPRVDHLSVVWEQAGAPWRIMRWDGSAAAAISSGPGDARAPELSEGNLIWRWWDGSDWEVMFSNGTGQWRLTNNTVDDGGARLDRNRMVWREGTADTSHVRMWSGGLQTRLTDDMEHQYPYLVANGRVYWPDTNLRLHVWDGATDTVIAPIAYEVAGEGQRLAWLGPGLYGQDIWVADGGAVTRVTFDGGPKSQLFWLAGSLFWHTWPGSYKVMRWNGTAVEQLSGSGAASPASGWGNRAVWAEWIDGYRQVFMWKDGSTRQLTTTAAFKYNPIVHPLGIFWNQHDGTDFEVYQWDPSGTPVQLTDNLINEDLSPMGGDDLLWIEGSPSTQVFVVKKWDGAALTGMSDPAGTATGCVGAGDEFAWWMVSTPSYPMYYDGTRTWKLGDPGYRSERPRLSDGLVAWFGAPPSNDQTDVWMFDADPARMRGLLVSADKVNWSAAAPTGVTPSFDVVRGDVANLGIAEDGSVSLGDVACISSETATPAFTDVATPPADTCWFYLVRTSAWNGFGRSSDGRPRYPVPGSGCL